MIKCCFIILMLSYALPVFAESLFIQKITEHQVTDEELNDAREALKQHKDLELKDNLNVNPFHHRGKAHSTLKQAFCLNCHLQKPHRDNELTRSFLNMHTDIISCETCHLNADELALDYRWLAYDYPSTGQIVDVSNSIHTQVDKLKTSIQPRPGLKIAPVYRNEAVLIFKDDPFSAEVEQQWNTLADDDKASLKVRLHAPLNKKGHSCKDCHSEDQQLLDYAYLGANEKLTHSITHNTISQFFQRYKKKGDRLKMSDLLR